MFIRRDYLKRDKYLSYLTNKMYADLFQFSRFTLKASHRYPILLFIAL